MSALVTVVTATWGRPQTVCRYAIPSIAAQTYSPLEHIIVTDGHDETLNKVLAAEGYSEDGTERRLVWLGRNWTGFSGDGAIGAVPRLVGSFLASGDYITYLDDDNEYLPHRIESMVAEIETKKVDIVFTAWQHGGRGGSPGGSAPPCRGQVDTSSFMHRASVLRHGSWGMDGYEGDGILVERWLAAGCTWSFLSEPTMILNYHRLGIPD
jgi:glycosyltransferase involved in cell wall biosynthesis